MDGSRFCGPEAYTILGALFIKYTKLGTWVNIYLGPPPRALEGARTTDGPWSLSFISFMVNAGHIQESGGGGQLHSGSPHKSKL
jgi:hypothetical protein